MEPPPIKRVCLDYVNFITPDNFIDSLPLNEKLTISSTTCGVCFTSFGNRNINQQLVIRPSKKAFQSLLSAFKQIFENIGKHSSEQKTFSICLDGQATIYTSFIDRVYTVVLVDQYNANLFQWSSVALTNDIFNYCFQCYIQCLLCHQPIIACFVSKFLFHNKESNMEQVRAKLHKFGFCEEHLEVNAFIQTNSKIFSTPAMRDQGFKFFTTYGHFLNDIMTVYHTYKILKNDN